MKSTTKVAFAGLAALLLLVFASSPRSQPALPAGTVGSGTNLSSVMYFEPPNDQLVKMRLTGGEMSPLPGTVYDVKKLKIERFTLDGKIEAVAEAPRCLYAPLDEVASSPGHLELNLRDGKIRTQGDGFIWQQSESTLYISNNVQTIIKGNWNFITP